MNTPLPPDDLPDASDSEFDALFHSKKSYAGRVLHSDAERETLAHSLFEIQRGDLLDEKAREVIRYMDALKQMESRINDFLSDAKGQRRKRLTQSAQMYERARDLWNSELALFLSELRLDLAALLENEYGKAALQLVALLRDEQFPPTMDD